MASSSLLLFLCVAFLFQYGRSATAGAGGPKAFVVPVIKDGATKQYVSTLQQKTPLKPDRFVVDLGSAFLWVNCDNYASTTFRPVPCGAPPCAAAGALGCTTACFSARRPGCNNNTCSGSPGNTVTHLSTSGDLSDDVLALRSTDGRSAGTLTTVPRFVFMCGASLLLPGLAAGSQGMLGLGRTGVSATHQLASAFNVKKKFALCLSPSTTSPGVIFFGDGPYVVGGVDASKSLAYTKLLFNPVSTAGVYFSGERSVEYFVKLNSISVNGKPVPVNNTLLDIHKAKGGTKISTVVAYTTLESSIYRSVEAAFVAAAAGVNVRRVPAVKPFGACFGTGNLGRWSVPTIELFFEGASFGWKIDGTNAVVSAGAGVECLGLVDGGENVRTAIVIGGLQLEDRLLEFDLEGSKLGFGSSKNVCAGFKFN